MNIIKKIIVLFTLLTVLSCEKNNDVDNNSLVEYRFINKSNKTINANFELMTFYKSQNVFMDKILDPYEILPTDSIIAVLDDEINNKIKFASIGSVMKMKMSINYDLNDSISYSALWETESDTIRNINNSIHRFEWPFDSIFAKKISGGFYKPRKE